ncbi:spore germination protein [Metabacillus idriensis]|uniref:spore germination protein n=1 Tax=Metabacillus idriensis TaxID=324768 RepID=UPI003D2AEEA1
MFSFFKKNPSFTQRKKTDGTNDDPNLEDLLKQCKVSADFTSYRYSQSSPYYIHYFKTLVDVNVLHKHILPFLTEGQSNTSLFELQEILPIDNTEIISNVLNIQERLMSGFVAIQCETNLNEVLLLSAVSLEKRAVSLPEVEYSVVGPKEAFVESLDANLNLIRKRLPIPELVVEEMKAGRLSKTRIAVLYIKGIANEDNINTVVQRIKDIDYDSILDSSMIAQIISDNNNSPFPQMIDTERPDRVAGVLSEGKITVLVDGSPHALTGPTTLVEFFSAFEDYFLSWPIASIFRLVRLFAVFFSVISTAMYVGVLTYHYEMIPQNLLNPLVASRSGVPFPPILEAIILELTIELLREAGARLPTKIGQTIGIVGGIVIGTAAVQAGLTSNVLLIIVALAALASFTTPVYQMGNVIRLIRFPFIFAAQFFGLIGIAFCFAYFLGHLLKLSSLGRPYLAPVYPLRLKDLKDSIFRLPMYMQNKRPLQMRSPAPDRFQPKAHKKEKRDIEE